MVENDKNLNFIVKWNPLKINLWMLTINPKLLLFYSVVFPNSNFWNLKPVKSNLTFTFFKAQTRVNQLVEFGTFLDTKLSDSIESVPVDCEMSFAAGPLVQRLYSQLANTRPKLPLLHYVNSARSTHHVCIIGSGPAGFYAAQQIIKVQT